MVEEKTWYQSKTIWGSLVAVGACVAGAFGISLDEPTQQNLVEAMIQLCGALGAVVAIYGRLSAKDMII